MTNFDHRQAMRRKPERIRRHRQRGFGKRSLKPTWLWRATRRFLEWSFSTGGDGSVVHRSIPKPVNESA